MKLLTGLLAAMLLLAGVGTSHAAVRIANDRGGQIGRYVERYEQLRASGQTIIIDGHCASSCTIVLGAIPREGLAGAATVERATREVLCASGQDVSSYVRCAGSPSDPASPP